MLGDAENWLRRCLKALLDGEFVCCQSHNPFQISKTTVFAISDEVGIIASTMVVNNLNPVRNWLKREYPRPDINPVRSKYLSHSNQYPLILVFPGLASRMLSSLARKRSSHQYKRSDSCRQPPTTSLFSRRFVRSEYWFTRPGRAGRFARRNSLPKGRMSGHGHERNGSRP